MTTSDPIPPQTLAEMIAYYRARAAEYDAWFYRQGRYDRGEENNRRWFVETEIVAAALEEAKLQGHVLELACGTGIWTQRLLPQATRITAIDASPEVIEINRGKLNDPRVTYVQADLFSWKPSEKYDGIFFGFWLSHVPRERLDAFWKKVAEALRPGGKVFFVDSLRCHTSTAVDHRLPESGQLMTRRLDDGREFQVVKNFYEPREIEAAAHSAGMRMSVQSSGEYFLFGDGAL
jgi:demethylmenaquinone methyltransferase/2-methoxy-6-polyprenyl-1,4-benzoquinol methylase